MNPGPMALPRLLSTSPCSILVGCQSGKGRVLKSGQVAAVAWGVAR